MIWSVLWYEVTEDIATSAEVELRTPRIYVYENMRLYEDYAMFFLFHLK